MSENEWPVARFLWSEIHFGDESLMLRWRVRLDGPLIRPWYHWSQWLQDETRKADPRYQEYLASCKPLIDSMNSLTVKYFIPEIQRTFLEPSSAWMQWRRGR